jgi:hypothetical protein
MLCDLENQTMSRALDFECVENWREALIELNVNDGTNDL